MRASRALAALLLMGVPALAAAKCRDMRHERHAYTVCSFETAGADLRLFLAGPDGSILGSFERIDALLAGEGARLGFAMNAGMYHPDRRPVGLYIEDGVEIAPAVASAGPGNFGMLPNGVFCLTEDRARVIETHAYLDAPPACRFATQSGPLLVIDGALHPRFRSDSTSRHVRNGVGVSEDGARVHFAISERPVTFHEFATFFRDGLGVRQALYLDGSTSRLHAPELGRSDAGLPMGPVVGLVVPAAAPARQDSAAADGTAAR